MSPAGAISEVTSSGVRAAIGRFVLPAVALVALGVFLLQASGILDLGRVVVVVTYLAIGPLGMLGSLELARFLGHGRDDAFARAGALFGISAFLLWEVVHAVQLGAPPLWREHVSPGLVEILPDGESAVRLIYLGVSTIQATMDVAFDVFFCLAIITFSAAMLTHAAFGRAIGGFGLAAASGLLLLNLWTFPLPPAEAGLWDLGPLAVMWWIAVIVLWQRHERRTARDR